MFDEFDLAVQLMRVVDAPPAVVGAVFGIGALVRSKLKKKDERFNEWVELEVKRQLDYIYSNCYQDMEGRVYDVWLKGEKNITVRYEKAFEKTPIGAYKTGYKDGLKDVAFKLVLPCILAKIKDDKVHYMKKDFIQYTVDTGQDIAHSFTTLLGRKVGITEFSKMIEEDALNDKIFIEMYTKVINRVREKRKELF